LLIGCDKEVVEKPYLDQVNQRFVDEAEVLFNGAVEDLSAYSSYTDNNVAYNIKSDKFDINAFMKEESKDLKKMGWFFFKKYNESYIFCDGKRQLEIISPRNFSKNPVLVKGSAGMQLDEFWHVIFMSPNNTKRYVCYDYKK
jgi:UDP-N-acetylmuramyl pentapeptide synthase